MISVAMATYNGERYIRQQLDSILNQSVQDFEIVACDDCSTDGTWDILQEYQSKFPSIRCFRNEKNLGFKANFEKAMRLCEGEFVALSDQDDIWKEDHLKILAETIGDRDIACGDAELIDGEGKLLGAKLSEVDFLYHCPKDYREIPLRIFYNNGCFQGASMLIRKSLLDVALPLPEGIDYHDTWLTVIACYSKGFAFTPQVITQHRRHDMNASRRTHWPTYLGFIHFKRNPVRPDRLCIAEAVNSRLQGKLSKAQLQQLNHLSVYYKNRKSKFGKLKNLLFRFLHYGPIYTTHSKLYIEW